MPARETRRKWLFQSDRLANCRDWTQLARDLNLQEVFGRARARMLGKGRKGKRRPDKIEAPRVARKAECLRGSFWGMQQNRVGENAVKHGKGLPDAVPSRPTIRYRTRFARAWTTNLPLRGPSDERARNRLYRVAVYFDWRRRPLRASLAAKLLPDTRGFGARRANPAREDPIALLLLQCIRRGAWFCP